MDNEPEPQPEPSTGRRFSPITFLLGFGFGVFIGVALALLAVALSDEQQTASPIEAIAEDTPGPLARSLSPTPDARPRTKTAVDVYVGPGTGFGVIGLLQRGESVEVVGRDAGSEWLAIRFPPGSAGRGWLPVSVLDGVTNVDRYGVTLPTPLPRTLGNITIPPDDGPGGGGSAVRTPLPAGSSTPTPITGPPDLFIAAVSLTEDGRVVVTVGNRGPGYYIAQTVFVIVRDLVGRQEQLITSVGDRFSPGARVTLTSSSFTVDEPTEVIVVVDPYGSSPPDVNPGNNTTRVTLAKPRTPTPVPEITTSPPEP